MKKIKTKSFILISSFFFLPTFSKTVDIPMINTHINTYDEIFSATWKQPKPYISTSITYNTLSEEEMNLYYPKPTPVPIPSNQELDNWFITYSSQYKVSVDILKKIAWCESHYNPNAINGIYGGMFQYSESTWISTRNAMGLDSNLDLRFNAEESIRTSAFKIASGGIGAWPTCSR